MKKYAIICLVLLFCGSMFAQTVNVDSLVNLLNTGKLSHKEQMDICEELVYRYINIDNENALFYTKKGLRIAEKEKDKLMIIIFYDYLGTCYTHKASYDTAILYKNKALEYAIQTKNIEQEADIYKGIGAIHSYKGETALSIEYFLKSLTAYEKIGNKQGAIGVLSNIASKHIFMNNLNRALYYLKKADRLAEELNSDEDKVYIYYNFGHLYFKKSSYEKALNYVQKAHNLSLIFNNKVATSCTSEFLALIYSSLNDYENAIKYSKEGLCLSEEFGDPREIAGSWVNVANVYRLFGYWKECAEAGSKALLFCDSIIIKNNPNLLYTLALANIHLGNKEQALEFLEKHQINIEEKMGKNYQGVLANLEIQYETEKKELRIAALEEKAKLYVGLSILGASFLLLLIVAFYFQQKNTAQKRKLSEQQRELAEQKVKQLEQEKQLVATQAVLDGETAERSRLARDLHDGLGGMLSVVKLNLKDMKPFAILEGGDMEHFGKALDMLDQSINELRRVAHHIMPDSLVRYGLKVALEDFCHAIPGTRFQFLGENPRLDNRLEVLIYRCAYELINNAVKHAQATAISVQLMVDDGIVSLTVQDNGIGFDPQTVSSGIGLENIKTRLAVYNGKMNIHSSPENGTEISIEIEQPL